MLIKIAALHYFISLGWWGWFLKEKCLPFHNYSIPCTCYSGISLITIVCLAFVSGIAADEGHGSLHGILNRWVFSFHIPLLSFYFCIPPLVKNWILFYWCKENISLGMKSLRKRVVHFMRVSQTFYFLPWDFSPFVKSSRFTLLHARI